MLSDNSFCWCYLSSNPTSIRKLSWSIICWLPHILENMMHKLDIAKQKNSKWITTISDPTMPIRGTYTSFRWSGTGWHVEKIIINPNIIHNATTTHENATIMHESVVRILIIHAAIHTHEVSTVRLNLSELHVSVVSVDTNVSNCLEVRRKILGPRMTFVWAPSEF